MTPTAPIDRFEFRNAPDEVPGYQLFTVEWATGIIRGDAEGFWSVEQATAHMRCWCACVREIHRRGLRVRVFGDLRKSQIQSQEVAALISEALDDLYRPEDRTALVLSQTLMKMQAHRVVGNKNCRLFLSESEAEAWLQTFGATRAA